jgi:hypothetical protein
VSDKTLLDALRVGLKAAVEYLERVKRASRWEYRATGDFGEWWRDGKIVVTTWPNPVTKEMHEEMDALVNRSSRWD